MTDWFADATTEFTRAAQQQVRRRARTRRARVAAVGLVLPAAVALGLVAGDTNGASAGTVRVREVPGGHEITLIDKEASPDEVAADLAAEDIDAQVQAAATGPSRQGMVVQLLAGDASVRLAQDVVTVPAGSTVTLVVGTAPREGQGYDVPSDAFAPQEPLACVAAPGATAGELLELLGDTPGVDITWRAPDGTLTLAPPGDDRVIEQALSWSPDRVDVYLTDRAVPHTVVAGCP